SRTAQESPSSLATRVLLRGARAGHPAPDGSRPRPDGADPCPGAAGIRERSDRPGDLLSRGARPARRSFRRAFGREVPGRTLRTGTHRSGARRARLRGGDDPVGPGGPASRSGGKGAGERVCEAPKVARGPAARETPNPRL